MRQISYWFVKNGQLGTGHINRKGQWVDFRPATLRDTLTVSTISKPTLTGETIESLGIHATPAKGVWLDQRDETYRYFLPEHVYSYVRSETATVFTPERLERLNRRLAMPHSAAYLVGASAGQRLIGKVTLDILPKSLLQQFLIDPTYSFDDNTFHTKKGRFYRGLTTECEEEIKTAILKHLFTVEEYAEAAKAKATLARKIHSRREELLGRIGELLAQRPTRRWLERWATLGTAKAEVESLFADDFREIDRLRRMRLNAPKPFVSTSLNSKLGEKIKALVLKRLTD